MQSYSARFRQKLYMKSYLLELAALAGRVVQADELLDLEQTAALRSAMQKFRTQTTAFSEIQFSDRKSERFKIFVQRLCSANSSPVYVWIQRTIDCGVLLMPSLSAVCWDFDPSVDADGTIAFVTSDLADSLLLDFSDLSTSEQHMKIEVQGMNWKETSY